MVRRGSGRRKGSQRCSSIAGKQTPTRGASQTGGGGEGEQHQREGWGRGPGGVDGGKYHWFEPHRSGEG